MGPAPPYTQLLLWIRDCAARERNERAPGPVTAVAMDCGFVAGGRPKRSPGRRRLVLFLPSGRCGSPDGRGVPARHCLSVLSVGLGALKSRAPAAPRGASRASPLLLLLLVPSPRLATVAPRRPLADRERSRPGPSVPAAGRGGAGRCLRGLAPGVAWAAGALHLCRGRVAALTSSRRGEGRAAGTAGGSSRRAGGGTSFGFDLPGRTGRGGSATQRSDESRSPRFSGRGTKVCLRPPR